MAASNGDPFGRASSGATEPPGGPGPTPEGVSGQAQAAAEELKQHARDLADDAKTRARAAANQQKDAAAERVHGFASVLRTAADDLSGRDQRLSASCVEQAADSLERGLDALQGQDFNELMGNVEDFAAADGSRTWVVRCRRASCCSLPEEFGGRHQPQAAGYSPMGAATRRRRREVIMQTDDRSLKGRLPTSAATSRRFSERKSAGARRDGGEDRPGRHRVASIAAGDPRAGGAAGAPAGARGRDRGGRCAAGGGGADRRRGRHADRLRAGPQGSARPQCRQPAPNRTVDALKRDADVVKEQMS